MAAAVSQYKQLKTGSVWGTSLLMTNASDTITIGRTLTQLLPVADSSEVPLQEKTPGGLQKCAIGPLASSTQTNHPRLAKYLAQALQARCTEGLNMAACNVVVADASGRSTVGVALPLWVLQWGA